jgi:hypothetical protein
MAAEMMQVRKNAEMLLLVAIAEHHAAAIEQIYFLILPEDVSCISGDIAFSKEGPNKLSLMIMTRHIRKLRLSTLFPILPHPQARQPIVGSRPTPASLTKNPSQFHYKI